MAKVILISQTPLPSSKIGSWTTLYKNYIEADHKIDFIICKKPNFEFDSVNYQFIEETFLTKIESKIKEKSYLGSLKTLNKILNLNEKYIIQVVDNFKIVNDLENLLKQKGIRDNCYIQFFYHGFQPYLDSKKGDFFFNSINEMVLLTNDSYKAHKNYYNSLSCNFSILHNGIDENKFFGVSSINKKILKERLNIKSKSVFLWCSQDRPKKGLDLILDVWKRVFTNNEEMVLLVIGANRSKEVDGVFFMGKISNSKIPIYYQVSDVYLFPTLCQEGFGLSLIEALHCNCFCIASNNGGVAEVLEYGKYGLLIERPNMISEWVNAINYYLENKPVSNSFSKKLYTTKKWNKNMNRIIENALDSL